MAMRHMQIGPSDGDFTFKTLVERVVAGDEEAWQQFVERFSNLVFSLVWRYAGGDNDLCSDLYLYVINGLHQTNDKGESFFRLRRYLASIDKYHGKGKLSTWLGRVTQNLVSDYFREQEGRKSLPRAIGRLDTMSQEIFKLLYWDCLPEREAYSVVKSGHGELDPEKFDTIVEMINRSLKKANRWSIYSEVIRRSPALPIHPGVGDNGPQGKSVQVQDPDPSSRPQEVLEKMTQQDVALSMARCLRQAIDELSLEKRAMLVLRFKHGLTAGQIAHLLKRDDDRKIYNDLDQVKNFLKQRLEDAGFKWEQFADALPTLDGIFDKVEKGMDGKIKCD